MKLSINIEMPNYQEDKKTKRNGPTLEEKVRECLECIESNEDSMQEWEFIRRLNNKLMSKPKKGQRTRKLLEMMNPVISKYGKNDPNGVMDSAEFSSARQPGTSKSVSKSTKYLGELG